MTDHRDKFFQRMQRVRQAYNVWYWVVISSLVLLPMLTQGTVLEERAISMRNYGMFGLVLASAGNRWNRWVQTSAAKRGLDVQTDPMVLLVQVAPFPLVVIVCYVTFVLFDHTGDWEATLSFSPTAGLTALCFAVFMVLLSVTFLSVRDNIDRGKSMFRGVAEPTRPWQALLFLVIVPAAFFLFWFGMAIYQELTG